MFGPGSFSDLELGPNEVRSSPDSGHAATASTRPFRAISRLPFSENRRIADDKNVNGSRTWLAVCRAKVVTRKQVLYRRTPTRVTPPFKLPPALCHEETWPRSPQANAGPAPSWQKSLRQSGFSQALREPSEVF